MTRNSTVINPTQRVSTARYPIGQIWRVIAKRALPQAIDAEAAGRLTVSQPSKTAGSRWPGFLNLRLGNRRERTRGLSLRTRRWRMGFRDPRRFSGRRPFRTSIQPTDPERGRTLHRWLPWLYLKGVETSDAREILEVLLGPDSPELSDRAFATLKRAWTREFEDWQTRNLV